MARERGSVCHDVRDRTKEVCSALQLEVDRLRESQPLAVRKFAQPLQKFSVLQPGLRRRLQKTSSLANALPAAVAREIAPGGTDERP